MVASVPSPVAEWPLSQRPTVVSASMPDRVRRLDLGGTAALLVWDAVVAVGAALLLAPLGTVHAVGLALLWVALLTPSRSRAGTDPVQVGTDGTGPVLRAGLALAFAGLVLGSLPGTDLRPGALAAYAGVVSAATVLQRQAAAAIGARTRTTTVRVVVAGRRHGVERMLEQLRVAGSPFTVVAVCVSGPSCTDSFDVPTLAGLRHLPSAVAEHGADAVIAVPCRHVHPARLRRLGWRLEQSGTALLVGTGLPDLGVGRARLATAGSLPLIRVRHATLTGPGRWTKQAWERVAAALALVMLTPLLLALVLLVRLDSPGPALFRQTRVGRDGRTFTMLKFRTMCVDAEDRRAQLATVAGLDGEVLFKMRADPRVTRLGRVLRTYSLDELPQLINVVRGEMALVGPRPPLPHEVEQYDGDARRRLAVTPGLTGLWQVSGRSDLSWEETVRLDLRYVENWSLGLDLRILARTVSAVVGHRGAY